MDKITVVYTPGVCNIGPAEIARRRNVGWGGLAVTVIALAALFYFHASTALKLVVFIPAFVAASGFLQAYFHFCSGFASEGVFNLGDVGTTQQVADTAAKSKDSRRGIVIMLYALAIAVLFTALVALM